MGESTRSARVRLVLCRIGLVGSVATALWAVWILATPLDQDSYEAYCQPLALEMVARTHPWPRCNDPVRFVAGVLFVIGGAGASILFWLGGCRTDAPGSK